MRPSVHHRHVCTTDAACTADTCALQTRVNRRHVCTTDVVCTADAACSADTSRLRGLDMRHEAWRLRAPLRDALGDSHMCRLAVPLGARLTLW